jgi:hypothetical protein
MQTHTEMNEHTEMKEHTEMEEHTETETETEEHTEDDDDEASTSTENAREDPNLNGTFAARRKAARRTLPWDLSVDDLELVSSSPQAEDVRATKRLRLEEPSSVSIDEAATTISSPDTAVSLPAPADVNDADHADAHPVKGARATVYWKPEEDAKLNSAVMNNRRKMKNGMKFRIDWAAVAALVPYRTKSQCRGRWHNALDPRLNQSNRQSNRRTGIWAEDEDIKLRDAVHTHGGKKWDAIAALVPGRSEIQCSGRWHNALVSNIDPATARTGNGKQTKSSS